MSKTNKIEVLDPKGSIGQSEEVKKLIRNLNSVLKLTKSKVGKRMIRISQKPFHIFEMTKSGKSKVVYATPELNVRKREDGYSITNGKGRLTSKPTFDNPVKARDIESGEVVELYFHENGLLVSK